MYLLIFNTIYNLAIIIIIIIIIKRDVFINI